MNTRRTLLLLVGGLFTLVVAGASVLGWVLWQRASVPASLVVVGNDTRLRLIQADGTERLLAGNISADSFRFPARSPDGRKLVYVASEDDALALLQLDLITGERSELYRSNVNRPFNMAWSPNGRYVNFLLQSQAGLSLHVVPVDGTRPAQFITAATSSFYAWKPDSSLLLMHLDGHSVEGGHLDVYSTERQQSEPIASDPGLFQAPAWSLDGQHVFYVAQAPFSAARLSLAELESQIVRSKSNGQEAQVLVAEKQALLRIVRAPNSDTLAYVAGKIDPRGSVTWGALKLISASGGEPRAISRSDEQVAAFFWSPDGSRIAYLSHQGDFTVDGKRTWHTVDVASGSVRDHDTFTPSSAFIDLQNFFDAYLFSFSPWSPDGRKLAYGAADGVYVIDTTAGATTRITDGGLALWVGGR